jgi:2-polyprenyl-6-hydroxyphenyl methylase/3-demethylubiquinone-9 3-methyltransferase
MTADLSSYPMRDSADPWTEDISLGRRFRFGENWSSFLRLLSEERIVSAEQSLKAMLETERLDGRSFLDAGSGSGLFSLAARRLGASVTSFDFDPHSIACSAELKRRYFPGDKQWTVASGSVLDCRFVDGLGVHDIVYSWGVLHHTGAMWDGLANLVRSVAPKGLLFIAIYNDQGRASRVWARVKRAYVRSPTALRPLILAAALLRLWGPTFVRNALGRTSPVNPGETSGARGMDPWHDARDWVGGYPFEVAKPEEIFDFCRHRDLALRRLKTCAGGLGCNEYVFERSD